MGFGNLVSELLSWQLCVQYHCSHLADNQQCTWLRVSLQGTLCLQIERRNLSLAVDNGASIRSLPSVLTKVIKLSSGGVVIQIRAKIKMRTSNRYTQTETNSDGARLRAAPPAPRRAAADGEPCSASERPEVSFGDTNGRLQDERLEKVS